METCKIPSHTPESADQLTDMFECSPEMSKVVKERFNQIHSQEINEITLNTQSKLSKVLGNEEKPEVIFNPKTIAKESQLAHYLRNIEGTDKFNTQKINIGNQLLSAGLNNIFEEKLA